MKLALIGRGAIASYAAQQLKDQGHEVVATIVRPERLSAATPDAGLLVSSVADLPKDVEQVIECAGHQALAQFGPDVLAAGFDLTTVSLGALADQSLFNRLSKAASHTNARLYLASGAIGAMDALRAANIGTLKSVQYIGRKPPVGWKGSSAEQVLDLASLQKDPARHFSGTAREAAQAYPKNANVAAAIAMAALGFDRTTVDLIADPTISENIHEVRAEGEFGRLEFRISGMPLADNPSSSALAAMSVVATVLNKDNVIQF